MRKEVARVFKDSTVYGLGSLITKVAVLVLTPIYTTYLTRTDYGILAFVSMVSSMLGTVFMLGQGGSLILFYRSKSEEAENRRELLFNVFWFVMLFAGILVAAMFLLGPKHAAVITGSKGIPFYPFLAMGVLNAYLGLPQAMQQAINRAQGQSITFVSFQLAGFFTNVGLTIYYVVYRHQAALGSLKGTLYSTIVITPIALVIVVRRWRPRFRFGLLWRSLRYGLPLVFHYFSAWVLTFIDRYLLLQLSTTAQVGLYSLAYNLSMVLNLFCSSINQAWAPIFYDLADTPGGREKLPRLTTIYASAVTAIAIAYTLAAPDALLILANKRFHAAEPVVPIVAGGYFFFALYMVVSTPIFYRKKTMWAPVVSGSAAALNIAVNFVLIPRYGMMGAAWATLFAYAFMFLLTRYLSNRLMPNIYENRQLAILVGIYAVSLGASMALVYAHPPLMLDLLLRTALIPGILSLLVVFRLASVNELRSVFKRRGRRPTAAPRVEDREEQERRAETIGSLSDDTGFAPDDRA